MLGMEKNLEQEIPVTAILLSLIDVERSVDGRRLKAAMLVELGIDCS